MKLQIKLTAAVLVLAVSLGVCACSSGRTRTRKHSNSGIVQTDVYAKQENGVSDMGSDFDFLLSLIGKNVDDVADMIGDHFNTILRPDDSDLTVVGTECYYTELEFGGVRFTWSTLSYDGNRNVNKIMLSCGSSCDEAFDDYVKVLSSMYGEPETDIPYHDTEKGQANFERVIYTVGNNCIDVENMVGGGLDSFRVLIYDL